MGRRNIFLTTLRCTITALSFFLLSCAGTNTIYRNIERSVSAGDYAGAIGEIDLNSGAYGEKNAVLLNLDKGIVFHYAGEYDSSSKYLLTAEKLIEDLYTKSVTLAALSVLTNDNVLPYEGEDFEKVFLNVMLALNFAQKGMTDDALVEARKVDLKLREYARKYEDKNRYKEDAFIRYIAGILYENDNEVNDAFISYKKSFDAYEIYSVNYGTPAPSFLLDDLVRTATVLSFAEDSAKYAVLGGSNYRGEAGNLGSVAVIVYTGLGPIKIEKKSGVSIPDSSGTLHTFQISLPKFQPRYFGINSYDVSVSGGSDSLSVMTELAEDITSIAGKSLDDRLTLVYLKSGGRALLKFVAAEKMKSEMKKGKRGEAANILGSLAIDLVIGATEKADLRCWRLLPAGIQMARIYMKPGLYNVSVRDSTDNRILKYETIEVRGGRTSFVIVNDIGQAGINLIR
jgi:hypothetical protein